MRYLTILFFTVIICMNMYSAPLDTKMVQWMQPNGVTFMGRMWGDEFFHWCETDSGYRFVQGDSNWYFYATLDSYGEFAPTIYRVGIDIPPASSYHLERSASRITELEQLRDDANEELEFLAGQNQEIMSGNTFPIVRTLGVILVEFPPANQKHYTNTNDSLLRFGYKKASFDSLFFSRNYWIGAAGNNIHPEHEQIFGSVRDYYEQMSVGNLDIQGQVLNPADANGVPRWIVMDQPVEYYDNLYLGYRHLWNEAKQKAIDSGWITQTYRNYAIIYSQLTRSNWLWPQAFLGGPADSTRVHIMSERQTKSTSTSFSHIGTHCHEIGHGFRFPDMADKPEDSYSFDLMSYGLDNGPLSRGECPASLPPWYRIKMGWVVPIDITADTVSFVATYNYSSPNIYKISPKDPSCPGEHYIFETRLREGFDYYVPTPPSTFPNQPGTLLIWHHFSSITNHPTLGTLCGESAEKFDLIEADDLADGQFLTDFYPKIKGGTQSFSDLYIPSPVLRNGYSANISLKGIRTLADYSTRIDTISIRNGGGTILISSDSTLSGYMQVQGDVIVEKNNTLTLSPGTNLIFSSNNRFFPRFIMEDSTELYSQGNDSQHIIIKSMSGTRGSWSGISLTGVSPILLDYTEIHDARKGINLTYHFGPLLKYSFLSFTNCDIGIEGNDGFLEIKHSNFINNGTAILCKGFYSRFAYSTFTSSDSSDIHITTGGSAFVNNCLFINGNVGIYNNSNFGQYTVFSNNTFLNYNVAIKTVSNRSYTVKNNILYMNNKTLEGTYPPQGSGQLLYNTIYNKDTATYTPPATNIERDPMFVNSATGDFHLQLGSPSVDAGDPSDAYNLEPAPNGFRINQGHYGNTAEASQSAVLSFMNTNYNMSSVPNFLSGSYTKDIVWAGSTSPAWKWDSTAHYVAADPLVNGEGYWIRFPSSRTMTYLGNPIDSIGVSVFKNSATQWNLIGSISKPISTSTILTVPSGIVTSSFFKYENGYKMTDVLTAGGAYWVKVNQPGRIILDATPSGGGTVIVCEPPPASPAGEPAAPRLNSPTDNSIDISLSPTLIWNSVIGSSSYQLQVSSNSSFSPPLKFNQSGLTMTSKQITGLTYSTRYYWRVNATNENGTSSWSCVWKFTTESAPPPPDPCSPTATAIEFDQLIVSDAQGNTQSLFVRNMERPMKYGLIKDDEMPPQLPGNKFHAKFLSNKFIETVNPNNGRSIIPIVVSNAADPITLSWNIRPENRISYWLHTGRGYERLELSGNGSRAITSSNGNLVVETQALQPCDPYTTTLKLDEGDTKPSQFALQQNMPNPFNPVTLINYDLPEDANVSLKVFNILGQEVITLVNEMQLAGYKSVQWNATEVPSGVYFYRLSAGHFSEVKKMLLTK
ncbi:MAG: T9SS type A sorting domain-containing protein [Ignavibacteriae bacterium]|nr:T9SS type A sorting domain-containing protein [Ignavibacteriota bacterium]